MMQYTTLVDVATLLQHQDDPGWIVFDCRFNLQDTERGRAAYHAGHIPGAHYAHLDEHLSGPVLAHTGRHPLPEPRRLADWLGGCGVGPDSQVVAYDDQGGAVAARLWWLCRWLGHTRVAVLDGGLPAWLAAGQGLEQDAPPGGGAPYPFTVNDGAHLDGDELAAALQAGRVRLLDARSPARFRGAEEPLDTVAGHVPGAVNQPLTANLRDGKFLAPAVLREHLLRDLEPFEPQDTVCMCGSGVTACHTLLAMEIAGLSGARLYPGSWSEWIRDPTRPVARDEG